MQEWLYLTISCSYATVELISRIRNFAKLKKEGKYDFVVAKNCSNKSEAEKIYKLLEYNGIESMIVEKENTVAQIQILRKNLEKSRQIIEQ